MNLKEDISCSFVDSFKYSLFILMNMMHAFSNKLK
jgi:hypothetical protein